MWARPSRKGRQRTRGGLPLVTLVVATALVACSVDKVTYTPEQPSGGGHVEDCDVAGDEDDNGLADCADPMCAGAVACLAACGNGRPELGEECDDGNRLDGDACESTCKLPICSNSIEDRGEQCDDGNLRNGDGCNATCQTTALVYVKASNTDGNDLFGSSIAISRDGSTLAIGAFGEASKGAGGTAPGDDDAPSAGAVYVYVRVGMAWQPRAYLKPSNPDSGDQFGFSLALSGDGATLAIGAPGESSAGTGTSASEDDNSRPNAGAAYVFARVGEGWVQQAYLKASNTDAFDNFGWSVALANDGATLAVSAISESSKAAGVDGDQTSNAASAAGAVYVFKRTGPAWAQQAYLKASNPDAGDNFGYSVALSADGGLMAVSAVVEDGGATGIDGDQANNAAPAAGAVYAFTRAGAAWTQTAYIKASNTGANDQFGINVALAADGNTLAVGAVGEDSASTGVDGDPLSNAAPEAGAAYVFARLGATWQQQAYVKASNTQAADQFGWSLALAPDGSELAIGAVVENSAATGLGGDQRNEGATAAGAVYTFRRAGKTWRQADYVKASNTGAGDGFGYSVALADDGTLVVGAQGESSSALGVDGDPLDDSALAAGAAYVVQ